MVWQLVSSRAQYREPLEQLFASAKSNSRTENRRCHCYIVGAMGRVDSKLFRPCAPTDTEPRLSTFRFPRFAICPRRLLFLPGAIWTRFNIRTMPDAFLFWRWQQRRRMETAIDAAKYRCRCYPLSDSICRRDLAKGEREDVGKSVTEMVVSCADRWSMKPPITRPLGPRMSYGRYLD